MVRFIHTSDLQLGMTRHFLSEGAQERFAQARFDAIRTMGRIAKEKNCQFMLVCGDTFESNQVDRKTVARAVEALREVPIPVYILPGNHDPLDAASVYCSGIFTERRPKHVKVIEDTAPIELENGVELVGAPWFSKRPAANPIVNVLNELEPVHGVYRIIMGHGIVDAFSPDKEAGDVISVTSLERAIEGNMASFIALGDRHSLTRIGAGERIWYSGTPEATDFSETQSGFAQVIEIDGDQISTTAVQVGQWRFFDSSVVDLNTSEDVGALRRMLEEIENKERTVVRLNLVGSLTLSLRGTLQGHLDVLKDLFGAFIVREDGLFVVPDDADFADLGFSGFADETTRRLREDLAEGGDEEGLSRDALMLLLRLAGEAS